MKIAKGNISLVKTNIQEGSRSTTYKGRKNVKRKM